MAEPTVDERLKRLELLVERAIAAGRQSALGRKILAMLDLR